MDTIKTIAYSLIHNLKPENIKPIKSYVGFLELSCDIVEEIYQRFKKTFIKITSTDKKSLAIEITQFLLLKLTTDNLISDTLANKIQNIIENEDVSAISDVIDDVIEIWNDSKTTTLRFCNCFSNRSRKIRKFEHIHTGTELDFAVSHV